LILARQAGPLVALGGFLICLTFHSERDVFGIYFAKFGVFIGRRVFVAVKALCHIVPQCQPGR
jgi:hypothetical protein